MKYWDIQTELAELAAVGRSIVTMMTIGGQMPCSASNAPSRAARDRWTQFDSIAGEQIITALRRRITNMPSGLRVSLWIDARGQVETLRTDRSSGDPRIDNIAEDQVLRNMQFAEPPPADMPMPLALSVIITPGGWIYSLEQPNQ